MSKYRIAGNRFKNDGTLRDNIKHVILKAPNLTYSFDNIQEILGSVSIVYMYRDIRDVVASMMSLEEVPIAENQYNRIINNKQIVSMFHREISLLSDIAAEQHIKMAAIAKIKMSLADKFEEHCDQVIRLHYEDIIDNPVQTITGLLASLDMPFSSSCLAHEKIMQGIAIGNTNRERKIDTSSSGNWKKYLDSSQEKDIWFHAGELMESIGYSR
jgi:hypothetical protein